MESDINPTSKVDVESIVRENIGKVLQTSLATVQNNMPWICEVYFVIDEQLNLYFRSLPNRRHSLEIAANPYVAGNIIEIHDPQQPVFGIFYEGTAARLDNSSHHVNILAFFRDRIKLSEDAIEELVRPGGHSLYKITVSDWYVFGRFGAGSGQKHHLKWNAIQ